MYTKGIIDQLLDSFYETNYYFSNPNPTDFSLELPVPGLSKDDLLIEVQNQTLVIKSKVKSDDGYISRYKNMKNTYTLDDTLDIEKIDAKLINGLLAIHIPLKKSNKKDVIRVSLN